jgi:hypothetical protein
VLFFVYSKGKADLAAEITAGRVISAHTVKLLVAGEISLCVFVSFPNRQRVAAVVAVVVRVVSHACRHAWEPFLI